MPSPAAEPSGRRSARLHRPRTVGLTEYSAGGVMLDHSGHRALAIKRVKQRGRREEWLLPKGHIEPGETARDAAEREVFEETGIRGRAGAELGQVEYWFRPSGRPTKKVVQHFLLSMIDGELSTEDHEVTDVEWFDLDLLDSILTHRDEILIVKRAIRVVSVPAVQGRSVHNLRPPGCG